MRTLRYFLWLGLLSAGSLSSSPVWAADEVTREEAPMTSPRGEALLPATEIEPVAYPACPGTPSEESVVVARGAFEAGNAAFNERSYARALLYWEDAYRRDCTAHAMLKNLARAYELDGQLKHAIKAIETYLELVPNSGEEEVLTGRVADLKTRLAERESAATQAPAVSPTQHRRGKARTPQSSGAADPDDASASEAHMETQRSVWPLVFAGAGAGVVGLSTVQWIAAKGDEAAAARACPNRKGCPADVKAAGNRAIDQEVTWSVVGIAGGAVLLGSVVWYLAQEPTPDHAVLPSFGPGYAGLSCFGRF